MIHILSQSISLYIHKCVLSWKYYWQTNAKEWGKMRYEYTLLKENKCCTKLIVNLSLCFCVYSVLPCIVVNISLVSDF